MQPGNATLVLFLSCVVFLPPTRSSSQADLGLCSQVYLMHQYCTRQKINNIPEDDFVSSRSGVRVGKAGPPGPPGRRGEAAVINYTKIFAKMEQKFGDIKLEFDKKSLMYDEMAEQTKRNQILIEELQKNMIQTTIVDCQTVKPEYAKSTDEKGGVYDIFRNNKRYEVYCDLTTDDGGWIVFQRRQDGSENFYRTWNDYAKGFGNKTGEFWLGLDALHALTLNGEYELRIDLLDKEGNTAYAKYSTFSVGGKSTNYAMNVGSYSGSAGDSMAYHNGMPFSTRDQDNDKWSLHCGDFTRGGWWFKSCMHSHLNGNYNGEGDSRAGPAGLYWHHWKGSGHSLGGTEMMFRKSD
ncbi:microfibril-associated glycoprotein 4-like isoform X1 [Styela clava]